MAIEWLTTTVGYVPGGVNIGIVRVGEDAAILIDTGLNDSAVRKALRALASEDRTVAAIVTTHAHADHFGANAFTVRRTGAAVYAPVWEEAVLRYPLLQPVCLFAGADPPDALRSAFLLAEPSPVDRVFEAGSLEIEGVHLEAIPLAGHSANQMGILVDSIFFCADVVLPANVIERYRMPYLYSVRDHVRSLAQARGVPHAWAVPGHGPIVADIGPLIDENAARVGQVAELVLDLCREPNTPEAILARVLQALGADPRDPPAYYLLHPTVFAYLSYLEALGSAKHWVEQGRSWWQRI